MSATRSTYVVPCVCGATVPTPDRETPCPACGRILVLEWGREPETHTGKPSQAALFDVTPNALEPSR